MDVPNNTLNLPNEPPKENPDKIRQVFIKPDESLQRDQIRTLNVLRGQSKCDSIDSREKLLEKIQHSIDNPPKKAVIAAAVAKKVVRKGKGKKAVVADDALLEPVVVEPIPAIDPIIERPLTISAETALEAISEYIANRAPLVIHVRPQTIPILTKDGYYRSTFETNSGVGGGAASYLAQRTAWESACFLKLYDSLKNNFERPKYGAMNFLNDPAGVASARSYGSWFMTLRPHVRRRVTVATGDTSNSRCLGVLDFCYHVLTALGPEEMYYLIQIASGVITHAPKTCATYTYREIQIHGELKIARDIEELHVDGSYNTNEEFRKFADDFSATFNIPLVKF